MASRNRTPITVSPRAKVWFEVEGNYVFGLGICCILEAVAESGSIKAAAELVGKSYRHVWSRIKEAEEALGISLVETQVGGPDARRSSITDAASQLVKRYRRLREQVFSVVEKKFAEDIQAIVNEAASAPQTTASDI